MEQSIFTSERISSENTISASRATGIVAAATVEVRPPVKSTSVPARAPNVFHVKLSLKTTERLQFIDITEQVIELTRESGIQTGMVNIQTRHTTTAIVVNEAEPLLLDDMRQTLDRIAPPDQYYKHNDFSIRTVNMEEEETGNGHSHCQALYLRASETLNLIDGGLQLGRWQRIFFIELDHARDRMVSIMVIGQ